MRGNLYATTIRLCDKYGLGTQNGLKQASKA
jgi:hypothetical protein